MKQMCTFILLMILCNIILCSGEKAQLEKFHHSSKNEYRQPSNELGATLPDADSYWEGWAHYYHYANDTTIARPKYFFQNNDFFSQRVPISTIKKTDKHGSIIVPNKSSFYLVLTQKSIQVFSSRDDSIKKQVDSLHYQYVNSIPEDAYMKGGIHDLGTFSIGNCVELKGKVPSGNEVGNMSTSKPITWVICVDKVKEKHKLLKTLLKLKLKEQRVNGSFKTEDTMKTEAKAQTAADLLAKQKLKIPADDRSGATVGSPTDGYWLLLQNWTDCTLKCGGGESFQQWECIPHKNGGKPCKGSDVRVRKCNVQPCPGVSSLLAMMKLSAPEVKKPIIKVAPFSTRLQRYSKCVVKENDAFISTYDAKIEQDQRRPVRIVMNPKTLAIYADDSFQNVKYSYLLSETNFVILSNSFCCFELKDSKRSTKICGYEKNCGEPSKNTWVRQWSSDFTLFKVQCKVGVQETLLTPDDEQQLADDLRKKLGQARLDVMGDKQKKLRQQMMLGQNNNFKNSVSKTQDLGLAAIQKELQLENLIKGEEKAKEDMELANLMKKIQLEKEKEACLHNTIKERDLDAEFLSEKRTSEQEVIEIKTEVAKSVQLKRAKMKKLIEQMRAKARLRKAALEAELNAMRQKMAQEMLQANKSGDQKKCEAGKTNADKRETFCNTRYVDDFVRNGDCKGEENFCYMCCEAEFGNMFIDRRESCYNMCDIPVVKSAPKKNGNGPWLWTSKVSQ